MKLRLVTAGTGAAWEAALVQALLHPAPIFSYTD
jgi:hypothetical protein